MSIVLNHMIVASRDRYVSARFLADLLFLEVSETDGPFVPVRLNEELTFDFDDRNGVAPGHFAFFVDDSTFDNVMHQIKNSHLTFGSGPEHGWDGRINHLFGGRGVYVRDPDGHSYEFFTAVP